MKNTLRLIFIIAVFSSNISLGQELDKKQKEVAENFLGYLMKGQNEQCWSLFDKTNVPSETEEHFLSSANKIKDYLSHFDSFELIMKGIKLVDDKKLVCYSFRATSTSENITDNIVVDVLFFETSNLIASIQPKELLRENTAVTSKEKETPLEKETTIFIEGVSYEVTGINIVHFENNQGLLAIQVVCKIPADVTNMNEWSRKEGIKFAKYLYTNGYVKLAKAKAKGIGRTLLDEIGVSFLDKSINRGFNTMIKMTDYK